MLAFNCRNAYVNKHYLSGIYPVAAISEEEKYFALMESHVRDVASGISGFAHRAIRISFTGENRLKSGSDSFVTEMCQEMSHKQICDYFVGIDRQIEEARDNFFISFNRKKVAGISRDSALAQVYAELVIRSMETNIGNCAEKALLAGILLKSMMTTALTEMGYTGLEIENANLRVTIAENGNHGGEHTVCLLHYNIGGEKFIVVDPWLNGTIYDQKNIQAVYAANLEDPNEPAIFDKVDDNMTQAVNDDECVAEVMRSVKSIFGEDVEFLHSTQSAANA